MMGKKLMSLEDVASASNDKMFNLKSLDNFTEHIMSGGLV
jgi:hypothetical protein